MVNADDHAAARDSGQLAEYGQSFRLTVLKVEQANADHPIEGVVGKGQLESTGTGPSLFVIPEPASRRQTNHLRVQINPESPDPQAGKQRRESAIAAGNVKQGAPLQPALPQQSFYKALLTPVNPDLI